MPIVITDNYRIVGQTGIKNSHRGAGIPSAGVKSEPEENQVQGGLLYVNDIDIADAIDAGSNWIVGRIGN